jgi:hypothetical protein
LEPYIIQDGVSENSAKAFVEIRPAFTEMIPSFMKQGTLYGTADYTIPASSYWESSFSQGDHCPLCQTKFRKNGMSFYSIKIIQKELMKMKYGIIVYQDACY